MYDSNFEICDMPLSLKSNRTKVERFLADSGLRLEDVDYYAAVTDDNGNIVAGGGLQGNVIKCIAVGEAARATGLSNRLISHLIGMATQQGAETVKVYTKPDNSAIFKSMGFQIIAQAPQAILMENGVKGIGTYANYLRRMRGDRPGGASAIVMNANPFTLGHRYLVHQAAQEASTLYVIAVREDRSTFNYQERLAMIQAGCKDLDNVVVVEGSDYAISELTFPTYFLKQVTDATDTHITLDLDLFAKHIAPALGVTTRYVGSEPTDELTARYNALMQEQLPAHGIEVKTIERLVHVTEIIQPIDAWADVYDKLYPYYIGMYQEELLPEPFLAEEPVMEGDLFLLCSDGVTDVLGGPELCALLAEPRPLRDRADALRKSWAVAKLHSMIEDAAASPSAAKENALSAHARGYGLDFDRRLVKPAAKEPGTHGAPQTTGKAEK